MRESPPRPSPRPAAPSLSERAPEPAVAILNQVGSLLNEEPDVVAAMNRVLPRLTAALGLHTAWMFLLRADGATVDRIASSGLPAALAQRRRAALREGPCFCQDAFRAGHLTRAVNMVECSRLRGASGDKGGLMFHASVPLTSKGRRLGILNVASPGRELFGKEALAVLSAVGQQVAVAIDRTRLYRDVDRRAVALTALQEAVADLQAAHTHQAVAERVLDAARSRFGAMRAAMWLRSAGQQPPGWVRAPRRGGGVVPLGPPARGRVGPGSPWHPGTPHPADVLPLEASGHVVGVLSLVLNPREPDSHPVLRSVLQAYATHIALALANVQLLAETERLGALEERQRLARELHDAVSQELFSATLTLAAAERLVGSPSEAAPVLAEARSEVQHALAEMRALVYELSPPDDDRLEAALRRLAQAAGATLAFHADNPPSVEVRRALFRIAQEAVHNALRHAEKSAVALRCIPLGRGLSLTIADAGPGFNPDRAPQGLGLSHMRARAAAIGADLDIVSRPGAGTVVRVEWDPSRPPAVPQ